MKNVKECRDVIVKKYWNNLTCYSTSAVVLSTLHTVSDNDVGCHRSNMCVMCSTSVPTLFQYFFYDHIPTFLYIFHEMFFITCCNYNCARKNNITRCR